MNIRKMQKYALEKTEYGSQSYNITNDIYTEEEWRQFCGLGLGSVVGVFDCEPELMLTDKGVAWRLIQVEKWQDRILGFAAGLASGIIVGVVTAVLLRGL